PCPPARNPSLGDSEAVADVALPSKANAGANHRPGPLIPTARHKAPKMPKAVRPVPSRAMLSNIRIGSLLGRSARMGHRAIARRADLLGVFPKVAGAVFHLPRLPLL